MELALQVLELIVAVPVAVFGATILVAGDRVTARLPWMRLPAGWRLRVGGFVYLVGGSWLALDAALHGIAWDAVAALYVVLGIVVFSLFGRARRSA